MTTRTGMERERAATRLTIGWIVAGLVGCSGSGSGSGDASDGATSSGTTTSSSSSAGTTTSTSDPTVSGSQSASESSTTTATTTTTTTTTTTSTTNTTSTSDTTGIDTGLACGDPEIECDGGCVNPQTDPNHCGECEAVCGRGELCSLGVCKSTCDPGTLECGLSCVDITSDPDHCGGCDSPCGDLEICLESQCVALLCAPGSTIPCYDGPPGTEDIGICSSGAQTCADDGMSYGACVGQTTPSVEDCETPSDDDCDGKANQGCTLENCKAIKTKDPGAADGIYVVDFDGDDGPIAPLAVYCDMTIDGGGWTRFNWLHDEYIPGTDPLGQVLEDCKVNDPHCQARIPSVEVVNELMVKDLTDVNFALWKFNGSVISNAVLGALQNKQEYCGVNQGAFVPYSTNSVEAYCGDGQEGGCDSFFYTSGSCKGVGNWGIHWDGDNAWCAAAFKMGATWSGCGNPGDQGFLNDCDCDDEHGELYFR